MADQYADTAWVDVLPSLKNFGPDLKRQLGSMMPQAGRKAGSDYADGFRQSAVDGVEKASAALVKARDKEADAAGRLRVAEAKLNDLRESGKAKASQLAAAEEAVSRAQRTLADSLEGSERAHRGLASAQEQAAKGTEQTSSGFRSMLKESKPLQSGVEKLTGGIGKLAGAAGGAAAIVGAFWSNVGAGQANDKLAAQMGLSPDEAKKAGTLAGKIYRGGFGESLSEVNDAVRAVSQNIGVSMNSPNLQGITTKVMNLSKTFDQDLGATTRAVGQLIRTGLAKDADEALDIITSGFQAGDDKADDFLDTLNEYGTQFRKVGLTGEEATGLISQGLKAGARDADVVADSIKEFSIRAVDGSTTTAAGFEMIGLNASDMAERIGKGGETAKGALQDTLDRLRAMPDPVQRSQAAVALFGTQAEDLGAALFALDPASAGLDNVTGSAQRMGDTLNDNFASRVETWKRNAIGFAQDGLMALANGFSSGQSTAGGWQGAVGQVGAIAGQVFGFLRDTAVPALQTMGGWIRDNATWLVPLVGALGGAAVAIKLVTSAIKTWSTVQALLNTVMEASPLMRTVALVGLVVGALITAYQTSDTFRSIVQAVFSAVGSAASWLWDSVLRPVFGWLQSAWKSVADGIAWAWSNIISPAWSAVSSAAQWLWNTILRPVFGFILDYWKALATGIMWAWSNVISPAWTAVSAAASWLWSSVLQPIFRFIGDAWNALGASLRWVYDHVVKPTWDAVSSAASWLWNSILSPIFSSIGRGWDLLGSGLRSAYDRVIAPIWSAFVGAIGWVRDTFSTAVDGIARIWDGIKSALRDPVQWVVDVVWNNGLRKLWNFINNLWGGDDIGAFSFSTGGTFTPGGNTGAGTSGGGGRNIRLATGGMMPGYTPGRDVHQFFSPTAGWLELSGGEPVLRPEAGRVLGRGWVDGINAAARSGGTQGVMRFLSGGGLMQGDPPSRQAAHTPPRQAFARGGHIGLPGWLEWPLKFIPGGGFVGNALDAINGGGEGPGMWGDMVWGMVKKTASNLWDKAKSMFGFGDGSSGDRAAGGFANALGFARSQVGKPYVWAATGPNGYDCSGFMSAITNVIRGRSPYSRVGATSSFPWPGFQPGYGPFTIGSSRNTGDGIGHMAGTLLGVNVESRGGTGVHVGPDARGASNSLFHTRAALFDRGGLWGSGLLGFNETGDDERVLTPPQDDYFRRFVDATQAGPSAPRTVIYDQRQVHAEVDARRLAHEMREDQRVSEFLYA